MPRRSFVAPGNVYTIVVIYLQRLKKAFASLFFSFVIKTSLFINVIVNLSSGKTLPLPIICSCSFCCLRLAFSLFFSYCKLFRLSLFHCSHDVFSFLVQFFSMFPRPFLLFFNSFFLCLRPSLFSLTPFFFSSLFHLHFSSLCLRIFCRPWEIGGRIGLASCN